MRRRGVRGRRALLGSAAGIVLAGLLAVGSAAPAYADSVVIDNTTSPVGAACGPAYAPVGQTFVATATGRISEVTLVTNSLSQVRTRELRIRDGGADGAVLGTQAVAFTPPAGLHAFTLGVPVEVVLGETYALEIDNWDCTGGVPMIVFNSGYADGAAYYGQSTHPSTDLMFRIVIETSDADGDGVVDAADVCADTTFTAGPAKLKRNQFWSPSADGFVDGTGVIGFTLEDTAGCSAQQIVVEAGLGKGHLKTGLSIGEMRAWVAAVTASAAS